MGNPELDLNTDTVIGYDLGGTPSDPVRTNFYHPQTKLWKGNILHVSVSKESLWGKINHFLYVAMCHWIW